jgi:hypothetical protein
MKIMRNSIFVTMLLFSCLVIPAIAQRNSGAGRYYNPNTEITVKGTVEKVAEITGRRNWKGIHLSLRADDQRYNVRVGPSYYLSANGFTLAVGDQIVVTGSKIKFDGADAIVAREIKKDGKVLTLRNRQGIPNWSRARQQTY